MGRAPGGLVIRELSSVEFETVWPIVQAVVSAGDTYAWPADVPFEVVRAWWTEPPARAWLAEIDGRPVGISSIRPNQPGRGDHVANASYMVAPEARGRGVARALCEHSLAAARAAGFTAMQFNYVVSTNEVAVRLWQRCGFAIVGRIPAAFRHPTLGPVEALVMHRFLEDGPSRQDLPA
jgi:GNAT superfamily N-acetyltransferase